MHILLSHFLKNRFWNAILANRRLEEEFSIDVKYMNAGAERMMLIDSGAPKSIVSKKWLKEYLREAKVN